MPCSRPTVALYRDYIICGFARLSVKSVALRGLGLVVERLSPKQQALVRFQQTSQKDKRDSVLLKNKVSAGSCYTKIVHCISMRIFVHKSFIDEFFFLSFFSAVHDEKQKLGSFQDSSVVEHHTEDVRVIGAIPILGT